MATLEQIGEDRLLKRLLASLPSNDDLIVGPGDDCAVIKRDDQWDTLFKTDVIVEGIHFTKNTPGRLIGRKALARVLSDIAAMGGTPEHALITLLVHRSRTVDEIEQIYQGLSALATEWTVSLAGGETSSLPQDGLIINVSLLGKVPRGQAILRHTAQVGDLVAVTGFLGDSFSTDHHLNFVPRIAEGIILRESGIPSAMMDVSDGLLIDLERLAKASGSNFILNESNLPCRSSCSHHSAMSDGEDYELLFSFNPNKINQLQLITNTTLHHTNVTVIGRIVSTPFSPEGNSAAGWQHFMVQPAVREG